VLEMLQCAVPRNVGEQCATENDTAAMFASAAAGWAGAGLSEQPFGTGPSGK